jgi:Uma2 family endonuclease
MTRNVAAGTHVAVDPSDVPALENGDRLTRSEFERRYHAMPRLKKAELIEGVVYIPSPVRMTQHGEPHAHVMVWLGHYAARSPWIRVADNSTVRLDLDNEPQPDAVLVVDPSRGGQVRIDDEGYLEGAPELVAEVASSSASYDLHAKLHAYRRNRVREYVVWRVLDRAIDWFVWRDGEYDRLGTDSSGVIRSEVFPGLWLDVAALVRGDLGQVLAVLDRGLESAVHQGFVSRLEA